MIQVIGLILCIGLTVWLIISAVSIIRKAETKREVIFIAVVFTILAILFAFEIKNALNFALYPWYTIP